MENVETVLCDGVFRRRLLQAFCTQKLSRELKGDIPSIPDRSTPSSGNCSAQNHVLQCRCILEGCYDSVSSSFSDTWPFHLQPESSLPTERSIRVGASCRSKMRCKLREWLI